MRGGEGGEEERGEGRGGEIAALSPLLYLLLSPYTNRKEVKTEIGITYQTYNPLPQPRTSFPHHVFREFPFLSFLSLFFPFSFSLFSFFLSSSWFLWNGSEWVHPRAMERSGVVDR